MLALGAVGVGVVTSISTMVNIRRCCFPAKRGANAECAVGETGYVWLNTPALMKGYFQRDDLTTKAVIDGWFFTGDIGVLDARGRLSLRGRERDEINKGGMKIYPPDVDAVVERFDRPSDVCTFAIESPGGRTPRWPC